MKKYSFLLLLIVLLAGAATASAAETGGGYFEESEPGIYIYENVSFFIPEYLNEESAGCFAAQSGTDADAPVSRLEFETLEDNGLEYTASDFFLKIGGMLESWAEDEETEISLYGFTTVGNCQAFYYTDPAEIADDCARVYYLICDTLGDCILKLTFTGQPGLAAVDVASAAGSVLMVSEESVLVRSSTSTLTHDDSADKITVTAYGYTEKINVCGMIFEIPSCFTRANSDDASCFVSQDATLKFSAWEWSGEIDEFDASATDVVNSLNSSYGGERSQFRQNSYVSYIPGYLYWISSIQGSDGNSYTDTVYVFYNYMMQRIVAVELISNDASAYSYSSLFAKMSRKFTLDNSEVSIDTSLVSEELREELDGYMAAGSNMIDIVEQMNSDGGTDYSQEYSDAVTAFEQAQAGMAVLGTELDGLPVNDLRYYRMVETSMELAQEARDYVKLGNTVSDVLDALGLD